MKEWKRLSGRWQNGRDLTELWRCWLTSNWRSGTDRLPWWNSLLTCSVELRCENSLQCEGSRVIKLWQWIQIWNHFLIDASIGFLCVKGHECAFKVYGHDMLGTCVPTLLSSPAMTLSSTCRLWLAVTGPAGGTEWEDERLHVVPVFSFISSYIWRWTHSEVGGLLTGQDSADGLPSCSLAEAISGLTWI